MSYLGLRRGWLVTIMHNEQMVPTNFVHGNQILDGLLERRERFVMIQVADMLADEGVAIDHQRDRIFQICSHSEDGPRSGQSRHGITWVISE